MSFKEYAKGILGDDAGEMKPISVDSLQQKQFLHVSTCHDIPAFIPMVTRRSIEGEDRRVPRVCGAMTLSAALSGYLNVPQDLRDDDDFDGTYVVYGLNYKVVVKPSNKLLPNVDLTEERWLVGCDEEHMEIVPEIIAELKVRASTTLADGAEHTEMALKVKEGCLVWLSDLKVVTGGIHKFNLVKHAGHEFHDTSEYYSLDAYQVNPITEQQWQGGLKVSTESWPVSSNWN